MNVHVSSGGYPALVLNADFRPLSYYPLSLWSWQDTIKAVFLERVNIVANYEQAVHSPSFEMKLPSVVSLKTFVKPSTNPAFTRFNVFLRDRFPCQHCGERDDLTFDHTQARGTITWVPAEISALDQGVVRGWQRTGYSFAAYITPEAGTSPVCRYYMPPLYGDSHFFGRGTQECTATGQRNPLLLHPGLERTPGRRVEGREDLVELDGRGDLRMGQGAAVGQLAAAVRPGRELDVGLPQ